MIKEGQIYREKEPAFFRDKCDIFAITYNLFTNCDVVYKNGKVAHVGLDWIRRDCELIREFETWQEAIAYLPNIK